MLLEVYVIMATQDVDILGSTTTGAVVKSAALAGDETGLVVRAIVSPANNSFTHSQVSIPTSSTQISAMTADPNRRSVRIKNATAYNLFLGGSSVSVTNGYLLMPGEVETFELGPAKPIYGVAPGATGTLYILELG
jgi:hypothetical protein